MAISVILDNIRSTYNVGAIMRTLDAVGGDAIVCCGITPYPELEDDERSPVVRSANTKAILKTSLGAENSLLISHEDDLLAAIANAKAAGRSVVALEQSDASGNVFDFTHDPDVALVLGSEVDGISAEALAACDAIVEIPQYGAKESLNVSVAAGIALYALR